MANATLRCIKTGATVKINGRYAHGDLFELGHGFNQANGYILRCSTWSHTKAGVFDNWPIHAEFLTWLEWWDDDETKHKVATIVLPEPLWFDYIGRHEEEKTA